MIVSRPWPSLVLAAAVIAAIPLWRRRRPSRRS